MAFFERTRSHDDTSPMLPVSTSRLGQTEYRAYHPSLAPQLHNRSISPVSYHAALFDTNTSVSEPYSEPVPWAQSTRFSAPYHSPLDMQQTTTMLPPPPQQQQQQRTSQYPTISREKRYTRNARHIRRPWQPGKQKRFPWRGLGALLIVTLLTGAQTALLVAANHLRTNKHPISPHTILSVLDIPLLLFTLSALRDGYVTHYWRTLITGTTISHMRDLYASTAVLHVVRRLCRFRIDRAGVATLLCLLSLARGPLLHSSITSHDDVYALHVPSVVLGTLMALLPVAGIAPLYHGYWVLGRETSLDPIEVARAFGAEVVEGIDGNATARDVEFECGDVRVRYGAVERCGWEKVLRVAERGKVCVRACEDGEIFG